MKKYNEISIVSISYIISNNLWNIYGNRNSYAQVSDILFESGNPWVSVQWKIRETIIYEI